ncbi:MAG: hypothetical protein J2P18_03785 [Nocardia sp.]|nr:hypothetical protein [Nocardia sp.]
MHSQEPGSVRADVGALTQAVDDGRLWVDGVLVTEGVHERCARSYESLAEQIEHQIAQLDAATSMPGFGGFQSGAALRRGFEGKATDAIGRLRDYADGARQLAETLRAAGIAYHGHDSDAAAAIARTGAHLPGGGHA